MDCFATSLHGVWVSWHQVLTYEMQAIAGAGIHDAALSVIQSPSRADVCEHCLWLLGNMAADGAERKS
eukprot:1886337-Amphidinium_carterae.1